MRYRSQPEPQTLGLFVLVVVMLIFGAGVFYEGVVLREPAASQLAVVGLDP